jgi:carboxypeptidase family protein/TonB-dependent receptor-like protein
MTTRSHSKTFIPGGTALILLFLRVLLPFPLYGQVTGATLSGTITDVNGGPIPGATISIKNVATEVTRDLKTNDVGLYAAPNLLPGSYEVTVTSPGFSTEVRSGIRLTVGAQQVLNLMMKVGQITQRVQVTGEAPAVQLASSTISGVVSETAVVQLPLNGRDWTQLATLQPGVDSIGQIQANTGTKDRARRGYGLQMTVSGSRPTQNNYRIDGISVNDYSNGGPGSVEGSTLGVDAVQEFSVLTSSYSAEYGRTSGGVINALSKSGTNQFHGDVYEFLRNNALDAANFFENANGLQKAPFRRNQFGASLGGPIRGDHTFFFGDYEGLRQNQGLATQAFVPSQAARNGILCSIPQPPPNQCSTVSLTSLAGQPNGSANPDPATGIDKSVLPFLGLWALPNPNLGLVGNGDTGIYAFDAVHITSENFETARVDHRFSDKDSLFGSFQYDSATATQPDPANEVLAGNTTKRVFVAIEETHIFSPQLINTGRVGLNRSVHTSQGLKAINTQSANPALGESAGADNPQIDVPGLVSAQPGLNQIERVNFFQNSIQGYDDVFLTRGIHSLKVGFAVERIQTNAFNPAPAGEFPFGSLQAFLTNQPTVLFAPLASSPFLHFGFRSTIFAGYVQDDVHLRRNLTVNLGLRYEMSTVPSEIRGNLSALRSPFNQSLQTVVLGNHIFNNPTLRNFEPRIGLAWDPFGNGKTSVRGSFGIFDVLPLNYQIGQFGTNVAPFTESGAANNLQPGDFPIGAFNKVGINAAAGVGFRLPYIQPNPKRNYVMQWNLSVQRELLPNLTAMVAYVGSRGVHMEFRADDINTVLPTLTSLGYLWPSPVGSGTQQSPNVGQMDTLQWNNDSYFHGLEVQLEKRMSHGFQIQGSYTWSKAIDGGDGAIASDSFLNSIASLFYFLPRYRRGLADFNVGQNLTINYIWDLPAPKSFQGPAAWVARGWQIGGILQLRSGLPFTPLIGGDPLGLRNTSAVGFPDRLTGPGCGSLVNPGNPNNYIKLQCFALPTAPSAMAAQCDPASFSGAPALPAGTVYCANLLGTGGRNEINGPGLVDFDFSVFKDTKIKEKLNVQFRAEFFNLFNHTNFNSPIANSTFFNVDGSPTGGAGVIDSTSTSSREIQLALKLIF